MKLKGLIFETSEETNPKVNPVEVLEEIINAVLLRDDTLEQETGLIKDYEDKYKVLVRYANDKNFYIYFNPSLFGFGTLSIDIMPQNFQISRMYKEITFKTNEEAVDLAVQYITEEIEKIKTISVRKQENIDFYKEFENVYEDVFYSGGFNISDNVGIQTFSKERLYRIPAESKNNRENMLNNYTLLVRLSPSRELLILSLYDVYDQNEAEVFEYFSSGQFDMKLILKNAVVKLNKALTEL